MRSVPYNTGKVRVGLRYQTPPPVNCADMDRLQSALLPVSRQQSRLLRREARHYAIEAVLWTASIALLTTIFCAPYLAAFLLSLNLF